MKNEIDSLASHVLDANAPQPKDNPSEEPIDHTARNGIITAIGVVLGFALTFLPSWSFRPGEWSRNSIFPFISLFLGILLIIIALSKLILSYTPTTQQYKSAVKCFIWGIGFIFAGVFVAIALTFPIWPR